MAGWTLQDSRDYFTFLNEASTYSGGASYSGYLTNTRDEALTMPPRPSAPPLLEAIIDPSKGHLRSIRLLHRNLLRWQNG